MLENELIWLCTRKDFKLSHQTKATKIIEQQKINWDIFFDTAIQHRVFATIFSNITKISYNNKDIHHKITERYKSNIQIHLLDKEILKKDIDKILSHFNKKSVDVLFAKGVALNLTIFNDFNQYYPGDMDLILGNKKIDVSEEEDQADITFFESLYNYPEWERYTHHDLSINNLLPINFQKVWQNAIAVEVGERKLKAFVMCPEDMLLFACINACRKRYFRLKSVFDIAEIINYHPDLNWEKIVLDAQEYECQNIIYTALLVTQLTVGCNLHSSVYERLKLNQRRALIIRKLASHLIDTVPLSNLFSPFPSIAINKNNVALLLVAITYKRSQIFQRLKYVFKGTILETEEEICT